MGVEMNDFIFITIIVIILCFLIGVLATLETRVIKKIEQEAHSRNLKIKRIRETNGLDGKNPFGEFDIWIGVSSNILGFRGENVYNKIVIVEDVRRNEIKYWVKVKTTFFIPFDVKWKKLKESK